MNLPDYFQPIQAKESEELPDYFEDLDKPESWSEFGIRTGLRAGARIGETIAGMPEALGNVGEMIGSYTVDPVLDFVDDQVRNLFGAEKRTAEQKQQQKESIGKSGLSKLPSSQDLREQVTQKISGDYLEPQNEWEQFGDEIVEDIAALSVGGPQSWGRKIGTAVASNLTKEAAKEFGIGKEGQAYTKMGTMLVMGLMGRPNAKEFSKNLYKKAYDSIPENEVFNAQDLAKNIAKEKTLLKKGLITPDKEKTLSWLNQIEKKIQSGKGYINVEELPEIRRNINSYRFGNAKLTPTEQKYIADFDSIINKELLKYGETNPTFLQNYRDANQAFAGIKQSNKIANYISRHVNVEDIRPESLMLLGLHKPGLVKAGLAGLGGAKILQLTNRLTKNPVLRRHYLDVIKASTKENATALNKAVKRLDDEISKEYRDNR